MTRVNLQCHARVEEIQHRSHRVGRLLGRSANTAWIGANVVVDVVSRHPPDADEAWRRIFPPSRGTSAASYDDATADPDIAVAIARCRKQTEEQALVAHQRCSNARLRTFSGVRSITDPAARRQMLAGVGTCSADTAAHVRTWEIIKQASIAATEDSGCGVVQRSADELWVNDTQLYEAVFAPDPLIARCLTEEARRNTAEQCRVDRRQRRLEAEAITDPNERGRRMQALPRCR